MTPPVAPFRRALVLLFLLSSTLVCSANDQVSDAGTTKRIVPNAETCPTIEEEIVDLKMLGSALRSTRAVGTITKLKLNKDIDRLLKRMRQYHDGNKAYNLEELGEQYNVLLIKLAAHLQDSDIDLHQKLCNAWLRIWEDLEDEQRFRENIDA